MAIQLFWEVDTILLFSVVTILFHYLVDRFSLVFPLLWLRGDSQQVKLHAGTLFWGMSAVLVVGVARLCEWACMSAIVRNLYCTRLHVCRTVRFSLF